MVDNGLPTFRTSVTPLRAIGEMHFKTQFMPKMCPQPLSLMGISGFLPQRKGSKHNVQMASSLSILLNWDELSGQVFVWSSLRRTAVGFDRRSFGWRGECRNEVGIVV